MSTFGERFKQLRKEKGLTQTELAKIFHTTKSSISKYENNNSIPEIPTLEEFASFFNTSIDYLLARTNERRPADKIKSALSDDPELLDFWDKLSKREDLQLLFKQTKDMSPKGVKQIIRVIKAIENEEESRH